MSKVVVLKIESYDIGVIENKLRAVFAAHFPLSGFFTAGDKILLKPNLLMPSSPEEAVVTHPALIEAVGRIFKREGFAVSIADSPGGFVNQKDMGSVYASVGLDRIARAQGFNLLYPRETVIRQGYPIYRWADTYSGPDGAPPFKMINMPKLKTHDIMVLTAAVKNLYGCVGGLYKSRLHQFHPRTEDFAGVVLKLYKMIKPALNIVDGIMALEGDGPAKTGTPRKLGVVVVGDDALCTDYVIGKMLNLADQDNPLIKKAGQEGLICGSNLEVISELAGHVFTDFKFPRSFFLNRLPPGVLPLIKALFRFRPAVNKTKCTRCGVCQRVCPAGAVNIKGRVLIDDKKCIRCMCCKEMCPAGAVDLEKSFLIRALSTLSKKLRKEHGCRKI